MCPGTRGGRSPVSQQCDGGGRVGRRTISEKYCGSAIAYSSMLSRLYWDGSQDVAGITAATSLFWLPPGIPRGTLLSVESGACDEG
jgi:hypothetical protein